MFPFVRMLQFGGVAPDKMKLNVDYRLHTLGSTDTVDQKGHVFSYVGAAGSTVVSTSEGNAMQFAGNSYFRTPMVTDLNIVGNDVKINIKFMTNSSTEQIPVMTGDYYTIPTITGGLEIILYNNTGTQVFLVNDAGSFVRNQFALMPNGQWNDVEITYRSSLNNCTVLNKSNSSSFTVSVPNGIGNGLYFAIGASYTRTSGASVVGGLIGLVQYVTMEVL